MRRNTRSRRRIATVAIGGALALFTAACGGGGGGESGGGDEGIIIGTTDDVPTLDPAECYSYMCGTIIDNVGNTLMSYQPGEATPSPDLAAAEPKVSEDGKTYTFTLRKGVKFHDGSDMTSEDVRFALNRAKWIGHPDGASFLLDGIESIETPEPQTVVMKLSEPDVTFTSKLAYNVATILPSDGPYKSPDSPLPDDASQKEREKFITQKVVATGPYTLEDFRSGESIRLDAFGDYFGEEASNDKILVNFFAKSAQLQGALQSDEIDVAFRHLTPEQRSSLEGNEDIKTVTGKGASIRYLVFNTTGKHKAVNDADVRKAAAAAIDRQRIVDQVLGGGGEPLYSMVPPLFEEANVPAFQNTYKDAKASDFLDRKVTIELWHESSGHYGDAESSLAQEIARMLEESGRFNVNLKNAEWAQFSDNNAPGSQSPYPAYLLGWYPDFLDPDNYIQPFYHSAGYTQNYDNARMDKLIAGEQTAGEPDAENRMKTFADIQKLAAEDAPIVPLYVETPYAFAKQDVQGLKKTMDVSQVFRFHVLSKG